MNPMNKKMKHSLCLIALIFLIPLSLVSWNTKVQAASLKGSDQGYVFTSVTGESVSSAESGKTTVLIFGTTVCGNTRATLGSIAKSSWVSNPNIRVIFAEISSKSLNAVKTYADSFHCSAITFCYEENRSGIFYALQDYTLTATGGMPFTVLLDGNNQVRNVLSDAQTAEGILAEINKFSSVDGSEPNPAVNTFAKVPGLKAKSGESSIKLSWKKVSGVKGYYIYQYTGKKWKKIATVSPGKTSYTVKKLKSAQGYRFGIKAYKTEKGKQVLSESYASLYTATNPQAVKFKVTAGKKKAAVKWNKVKGADKYEVVYKLGGKGAWKKLKTTKGLQYTKKKLKSGETYTFAVKACKVYKGKTYTSSIKGKTIKVK